MRKNLLMAAVLGLCAAPAMAQDQGAIEIGGFVRYNKFDKSFDTSEKGTNQWGGGGRLGYFFSKHWAVEADASGNATDVKDFFSGFQSTGLTYYPFHLRVVFNQRLGESSPISWFLGVGPGYARYGKDVPNEPGFKGSDWSASAITGFRAMLTSWLAFRVDGTLDYIWDPNNGKPDIVGQFAGITAAEPPDHNLNLGAQAGLSVMLGMCNRSKDGTTISPSTATVRPGETATFTATATNCGRSDAVVYNVSGPGSIAANGVYTAAGTGTATVSACGRKNHLCSSANVTIEAPAPPAPPPPPPPAARTLTRCELTPASATVRIDQPVSYTVTCFYSDGTSEAVSTFTLTSAGGTVTGNSIAWATPGTKNVTAVIPNGPTLSATVDVQQLTIVVRDSAFFEFDKTIVYRMDDQSRLNEIAKVLKDKPDIKLTIDGHADADGTVKYNERLAMRRAVALKNYLAGQGVPVDRMTIILRTYGECVPVASNETDEGRALNRRAELKEFGNTMPGPGNAVCREAGRERKP
jgi:outer membrane protein OmpA-like peptidoglycan-associated protein